MRTTIDIPGGLLREAQASFGVKTKREAVLRALQEHVDREKRLRLHEKMRGRFPGMELDMDKLRERVAQ